MERKVEDRRGLRRPFLSPPTPQEAAPHWSFSWRAPLQRQIRAGFGVSDLPLGPWLTHLWLERNACGLSLPADRFLFHSRAGRGLSSGWEKLEICRGERGAVKIFLPMIGRKNPQAEYRYVWSPEIQQHHMPPALGGRKCPALTPHPRNRSLENSLRQARRPRLCDSGGHSRMGVSSFESPLSHTQ